MYISYRSNSTHVAKLDTVQFSYLQNYFQNNEPLHCPILLHLRSNLWLRMLQRTNLSNVTFFPFLFETGHFCTYYFTAGATAPPPQWAMTSSFTRFLDRTKRRTTVGRTSLNEWSARCLHLYLTTHNTHNRKTSMPPAGFEPTIADDEWPQTYALDREATGNGCTHY